MGHPLDSALGPTGFIFPLAYSETDGNAEAWAASGTRKEWGSQSMTGRKRKIFSFVVVLFALVATVVIALPLWLPWALGPAFRHSGVHYAKYLRVGYSRFALM